MQQEVCKSRKLTSLKLYEKFVGTLALLQTSLVFTPVAARKYWSLKEAECILSPLNFYLNALSNVVQNEQTRLSASVSINQCKQPFYLWFLRGNWRAPDTAINKNLSVMAAAICYLNYFDFLPLIIFLWKTETWSFLSCFDDFFLLFINFLLILQHYTRWDTDISPNYSHWTHFCIYNCIDLVYT